VRASGVSAEDLLAAIVRALHGAEVAPLLVREEVVCAAKRLLAVRQPSAVVLWARV